MKKIMDKVIVSLLISVLCIVTLVGVSYSWYGSGLYSGHAAQYEKKIILGGVDAAITMYSGVLEKDSKGKTTISYFPIDVIEGFSIDNLYPGARQYFKTTVKNTSESDMAYSVFINNIHFSEELIPFLSIHVTAPTTKSMDFANMTYMNYSTGEKIVSFYSLCDKYQLHPGDTIDLYWYIEFDEGAGNECSGKHIKIESISLGN